MHHLSIALVAIALLTSCSSVDDPFGDSARRDNQISEYIDRRADERLFVPSPPQIQPPPQYPWYDASRSSLSKISKEFFRCRGSELNPMRVVPNKTGTNPTYLHDCAGTDRHSLPLRDGEEFIYPILIDLLNHIQAQTGKRVVVTAGHRCPAHHSYVEINPDARSAKHLCGAACSFYVEGLEERPEVIVQKLQDYYRDSPKYQGLKEYQTFTRDKNGNWNNKEVSIHIYGKQEGRSFDNRHPYPYVSIAVRYDFERNEAVSASWEQAQSNYMRW